MSLNINSISYCESISYAAVKKKNHVKFKQIVEIIFIIKPWNKIRFKLLIAHLLKITDHICYNLPAHNCYIFISNKIRKFRVCKVSSDTGFPSWWIRNRQTTYEGNLHLRRKHKRLFEIHWWTLSFPQRVMCRIPRPFILTPNANTDTSLFTRLHKASQSCQSHHVEY